MKKGERRKQELLKIAYEMFITRGYENTSVDELIEKAGIAKGTYYYYFPSKEQMLEEVIDMMLGEQVEHAKAILDTDIPIPQKIVGIVASIRPAKEEAPIDEALHLPENILMHEKIKAKITECVSPLLVTVTQDGIAQGLFDCDNVPERIKIIMIIVNELFGDTVFTPEDIEVFIDVLEKILGARQGSMSFVRELIGQQS